MRNKLFKIIFPICAIALFFVLATEAEAVNTPRYWVGGTGNWSTDTTHWSDSSGGAGGQSVPDTDDDVYFDEHSNESGDGNYTVTITGQNASAANLSFARAGDPDTGGVVKLTMNGRHLNVYGNLTLHSGMDWTSAAYSLTLLPATGVTAVVTSNGARINCHVIINGAGTVRLADQLELSLNFTLTAGTFDASTNSVTVLMSGTDETITGAFTGSSAFYNLNRTPATAGKARSLILGGNIEVTNLFTVSNGATITNRVYVQSSVKGTARTITAASIAISNADFQDITGAGAASWDLSSISGGSGNCGGNTMKALGDAAFTTAQTQYWVGGTGNWETAAEWGTTSGGSGGRVPLCQDDVIFDENSFASDGLAVATTMPRLGKTIDFRDTDQTFNLSVGTACSIFGSLYLDSNVTPSTGNDVWTFEGRGAYEFSSAGKTWSKTFYFSVYGGSITLLDALTTDSPIYLYYGGLDLNDQNLTAYKFGSNTQTTRTLSMGSGTTILNNGAYSVIWEFDSTNLTFDAETSTIKITANLTANRSVYFGSDLEFNIFWFAFTRTGAYSYAISHNASFNEMKIDAGCSLGFGVTTQTFNTFTAVGTSESPIILSNGTSNATFVKSGGGTVCSDWLTVDDLTVTPADTWYFGANSVDNGGGNTGMTWGVGPCGGGGGESAASGGGVKIIKDGVIFKRGVIFKK